MYGYEPPKHEDQGSWAEIFAMTRAVFVALLVPLALIAVTLGLMLIAMVALFSKPIIALIPLAILALGAYYLVRRDRQAQDELDEEIHGTRPYSGPRGRSGPPR